MMSLSPTLPPADLPQTLNTLSALIALLADPKAAQERVAEMQKASEELRNAIDASKVETAGFAVAKAAHQGDLAKATAAHANKLAGERTAFDAECSRRKSDLDSQADQVARLKAKAQTDADAAANIRADLERRLSLLKEAAGS
jgi:hypothetical protein